jgi:proteasome activator subunit 3 (PA28 gamma)
VLDNSTKYYDARAKIVTKMEKHPANADYKRSLEELDEKQLKHLIMCGTDLRNNYAILYDTVNKNIEKIMRPRSSSAASMY